ncbi:TIGR02099 family protein [Variovorax sp. PAMC28562]|uniref:YhdP family protein n=1 Tax=Variovorax sp. PAMC28562 TaxID=2762323 RepID=UPI00164E1746|nr:YhdP family protein [Variovorax sp. PAMC28562]QNK74562.1 TIGR02099 family protein [Variovorax sp. PAMC28562]
MNDTVSSPSRLLKVTAVTARWLLGLLMGAWLVFALSVLVLHGWIVPRIGEYRGALEAQASRVIGVPVRIGSITAQSNGLFPTFELRDVVLQDAQQRDALRLSRVVASVSPRSLWKTNFEQLYIESPQLEVRLDAAGKLHVAGLDVSTDTTGETRAADWFFGQREFIIQGGTVRWTDERRHAEPVLLTNVEFVSRNSARRHALRLDATPPAGWGDRFTLRGQFRQPLLSVHSGKWQSWNGQIYADLPNIDATRLGRYVALDARIREGNGALRVWADVDGGKLVGGAADLGLARIDASLGDKLQPLVLRAVTGRLAGQLKDQTLEFSTRDLQFDTADGSRWPGGNLWFQHTPARGKTAEHGAFKADRLDLGALALIADRLPLGEATHKAIESFAPRGLVERIDTRWQGPFDALETYQAKGRVSGFSLASQAPPEGVRIGTPGLRGATAEFDASQAGGTASLSIAKGALDLPGVFEEPVVPIDQLSSQLQWKLDGDKAQVQVSKARFANADAEGEAEATWRTSDPAVSHGKSRHPGVLDLQGKLTRADGTRVFRYLPLDIPKPTRDYVRDAVNKGSASIVEFRVKGDLHDMPFMDPRDGDFRIAAKVADVTYAYVPPQLAKSTGAMARGVSPAVVWPALDRLSGELVFERAGMLVRNARGRIVGAPGIEIDKAEAQIADMAHPAALLKVDAQARGPLAELLHAGAALAGPLGEPMGKVRATGNADYRLKLDLPLAAVDKAKVQASIALTDNDLQLVPEAPALTQARGTLNFTEGGFSLAGVQARLMGGETRIEGKGRFGGSAVGAGATPQDLSFKATGTVTAEGLRAAREVDWLARLATKATGSAGYAASLSVRDGTPEFLLTSSLVGLGLNLPAPLAKPADEAMPLKVEKKVLSREARAGRTPLVQDQLSVELGKVASAQYVRDVSGDDAKVSRGFIAVGLNAGEAAAPPPSGVQANINLARLDLAAWQALFTETTGSAPEAVANATSADDALSYLPTMIAVRAKELAVSGRTLHDVVLGGTRDGTLWRANIDAVELSGYAEYRHTQAGRLHARLARLKIAPSEAHAVESLLDEQPDTLPALDVVVDDFELLGKRLGRAEIDAVNLGGATREWKLNKLSLTMPEATFTAQGSWAAVPGAAPRSRAAPRRTSMNFKLDIADAGALLNRFGMKDVLRRGKGKLGGDVDWQGSPFSLDYPSLNGQLQVDVESGQFLKADPGLAKLLGVLNLQALPRRLTLDFRDVFSQGFSFDFVRGDARIVDGTATTNNLQMKGVNAAALLEGSADIARETQNLRVVVVPEITAGTAALVATAINPAIGLGTFLAQWLLSKPLSAAATQEFQIEGSWTDPKITKVARRTPLAGSSTAPGLPSNTEIKQ